MHGPMAYTIITECWWQLSDMMHIIMIGDNMTHVVMTDDACLFVIELW